jgi:hypothetical protein
MIPSALKTTPAPELFCVTAGQPGRGIHSIVKTPDIVDVPRGVGDMLAWFRCEVVGEDI